MNKRLASPTASIVARIVIMISGFTLAGSVHFGVAQSSTPVIGIIHSDTTWTKANSPYSLTGPVAVSIGVTLTIEAGTTINLNSYYIQVNGTLSARGSSTNKIHFNDGSSPPNWAITFKQNSASWNEQTGTGSIIENAVINSTSTGISIENVTPKINDNSISAFYAIDIYGGSPVISNNTINGGIGVHEASPTITGNTINGYISATSSVGTTIISNNTLANQNSDAQVGISCSNAVISNNVINGFQNGIITYDGISTIERNIIINNENGIGLGYDRVDYSYAQYDHTPFQVTIRYNTINSNSQGISLRVPLNVQNANFTATIDNNNVQNNSNYNFYSASPISVNVTNNWWGTTDAQTISQTIHDFKNDFNLGTVTFIPFLTEPNPNAPIPTSFPTPIQTQSPAPSLTPSPSIPEFPTWIILPLLVATSAFLLRLKQRVKRR